MNIATSWNDYASKPSASLHHPPSSAFFTTQMEPGSSLTRGNSILWRPLMLSSTTSASMVLQHFFIIAFHSRRTHRRIIVSNVPYFQLLISLWLGIMQLTPKSGGVLPKWSIGRRRPGSFPSIGHARPFIGCFVVYLHIHANYFCSTVLLNITHGNKKLKYVVQTLFKPLNPKSLQEIMRLIDRMVSLSNRHGHALHVVTDEGWTARPVVVCLSFHSF